MTGRPSMARDGGDGPVLPEILASLGVSRNAVFDFEHPVFSLPQARFAQSRDKRAVFHFSLGSVTATVGAAALEREFGIAPASRDGKLLSLVEPSLRHVKDIRVGASIPRELLDGTASWSIDEKHHALAEARIVAQLVAWIEGRPVTAATPDQLLGLAADPATRERVQDAFGKIAEQLGLPRERKEEVIDRVATLTAELSYIEALRDAFGRVDTLRAGVAAAAMLYQRDRSIAEELLRVANLLRTSMRGVAGMVMQVEAQTGEIVAALKNIEAQVAFIRGVRDELRQELGLWDEVLPAWSTLPTERSRALEAAIRALYGFLARRYAPERSWRS